MTDHAGHETASEHLQRIYAALEGGKALTVKRSLHALHPAEIALLVESLPRNERSVIWGMVDAEDRGETLLHLPESVREDLIEHMEVADLVAASKGLSIDDLADFVENLPETVTQQVLRAMDTRDRERLERRSRERALVREEQLGHAEEALVTELRACFERSLRGCQLSRVGRAQRSSPLQSERIVIGA